MRLTYDRYLDQILGGWIGKCIGGTIGDRFEGNKSWIEIEADEMFPETVPPNDDLDLQILWLKVLEERGASLTSEHLADAWLESCQYAANEYSIFSRNWRLGIHPPYSGEFSNAFWETGEGCPIRAEIWGYVFPGAPDLAAAFAAKDGTLDHTEQSVGAEQMLAAMCSMAFFVSDVRRLAEMFIHYLPAGSPIELLTRAAFASYDEGLSLREAHERLMALAGHPEACDSQVNVPFTFLGLLYGENDLQKTLLSTLKCGYDADCTLASAAALIGQILGANRVPTALRDSIGDELVMGIKYRRKEMTLSALARDTARIGVLLSQEGQTGVTIANAPDLAPLPATAQTPATWLTLDYEGEPAAGPGETVTVAITAHGRLPVQGVSLSLDLPPGWDAQPASATLTPLARTLTIQLRARPDISQWPMRHLFTAKLDGAEDYRFGVAGASLWQFLGVYYDPIPEEGNATQKARLWQHHFVRLDKEYLTEPSPDVEERYRYWSHLLGKPAVVMAHTQQIDVSSLIGLRGPYCVYLSRTVISPDERDVYLVIGNTDGYRLYLNGELAAERDESLWWTPFNNVHPVQLKAGENRILLKLLKRGETLTFSFGIRHRTEKGRGSHNKEDWCVDLTDVSPLGA